MTAAGGGGGESQPAAPETRYFVHLSFRWQRSSSGLEKVLGSVDPRTARAYIVYGTTLRNLGDLSSARDIHERWYGVLRDALGEEHVHTLNGRRELAITLLVSGQAE